MGSFFEGYCNTASCKRGRAARKSQLLWFLGEAIQKRCEKEWK